MSKVTQFAFKGRSGYIIGPQETGQNLVAIGHTALVTPWADPSVHEHTASEEYYFLRQGELRFLVAGRALTLRPGEIMMVKPGVPHAVIGGAGLIEHFGIRAPALNDKRVVGDIPQRLPETDDGERDLTGEWGYRISLASPRYHNCWLIGAGSALFESRHLTLAYLNFPSPEAANAGLGTRHRLHYHRRSWEYYVVLAGVKRLQIEADLVTLRAGDILEVPPQLNHTLHSREAPYEGFTLRVPLELQDKVEVMK
jgi:mannose-6-phosphate isomerase-like protein (cupin superfamily)